MYKLFFLFLVILSEWECSVRNIKKVQARLYKIWFLHKYKINHCVCVCIHDLSCNTSRNIADNFVRSKIMNVRTCSSFGIKKTTSFDIERWQFRAILYGPLIWVVILRNKFLTCFICKFYSSSFCYNFFKVKQPCLSAM